MALARTGLLSAWAGAPEIWLQHLLCDSNWAFPHASSVGTPLWLNHVQTATAKFPCCLLPDSSIGTVLATFSEPRFAVFA